MKILKKFNDDLTIPKKMYKIMLKKQQSSYIIEYVCL